ncbi:MAG TPA: response regulator transcription factor [Acidimicrobiales bacterium]|nr:response regulator transcription factor [Acidimicrobiales bacterium]
MSARILLIEDDESIRTALSMFLEQEGYTVADSGSGEEGLVAFDHRPADIVLVDIMLPGLDGLEVTRALRRTSDVPIVMVTARSDTHDVVAGLEAGADDYVPKPVVAKELAARIRALLRRSMSGPPHKAVIRVGDLEIHRQARTVRRGDEELRLTRTEFRLLCALAENPGWVLSRTQLLERVWDYDFFGDIRLVDVHVRRLRAKIEDDPSAPRRVVTVRGLGYKLQP